MIYQIKPAILLAVGVPVLLGLSGTGLQQVRFAPSEGLTLIKTFNNVTSMAVEDHELLVDGKPLPFSLGLDLSITSTIQTVVVDSFGSTEHGRPDHLERKYLKLANNSVAAISAIMMSDEEIKSRGSSDLEGLSVVFNWSPELGDFVVGFAEDSRGDDALLEGLTEDMDLRSLLPQHDVIPGDTWTIAAQDLMPVLSPGGDLSIVAEAIDVNGIEFPSGDLALDQMLGKLSGKVTAEFIEVRKLPEATVAAIQISVDIESINDLTEILRAQLQGDDDSPESGDLGMNVESVDVELAILGNGELLWDLTHGHFIEFNLSTAMEITMDQTMSMPMDAGSRILEQSVVLSATSTLNYTTERQ